MWKGQARGENCLRSLLCRPLHVNVKWRVLWFTPIVSSLSGAIVF